MDGNEDDYYEKETFKISKEEIKGMGISSLYNAFDTENNEKYLCKLIRLKQFKENDSLYEELKRTIQIHHKIQNENFTFLFNVIQGATNLYILYNYIEGKTLFKLKKEGKNFDEKEIKKILEEVMKALMYLYNKKIILKDLKLENIFLTNDGKILLCNLEKNYLLNQTNKEYKLVNAYINIALKFGLIICKLVDYNDFVSFLKTLKSQSDFDLKLINEYVDENILSKDFISKPLKKLIKELLKGENNRIKITDIKSHEYFQSSTQKKNDIIRSSTRSTKEELKNDKQNINVHNISRSTIADISDTNIKINNDKNIKEETIITDEAYLVYYKKEREVLLGLIDSFDENEIIKNVKLAEKYSKEKAEKDKIKAIPEKKVVLVNENKDNNINNSTLNENEREGDVSKNDPKKNKKKKFLGIF